MAKPKPSQVVGFLRGPGFQLVLLLASIAGPVLGSLTRLSPSLRADPERAVITGVFIFLIGEVVKMSLQMDSIRHSAKLLQDEMDSISSLLPGIDHAIKLVAVLPEVKRLKDHLETRSDHIGSSGIETFRKWTTLIEHVPGGFIAKHEPLAVKAYEHFWQMMRAEQEKLSFSDSPLVVRVTHSSDPSIFDKPELSTSLNLQKEFADAGGIIVRVFLDKDEKPSDQISRQMTKMQADKVHAFYLQSSVNDQLDSDFLWTSPYLVEWFSGQMRQALRSCQLTNPDQVRRNDIADQWCSIGRKVIEQRGHRAIDPKVLLVLQKF